MEFPVDQPMLKWVPRLPKRLGAKLVGRLVYTLFPKYRARLLDMWFSHGPRSGVQRLVFLVVLERVLSEYYHPSTTTSSRERIKQVCGTVDLRRWLQHYEAIGCPPEPGASGPTFRTLEDCLAAGDVNSVHQAACRSGREVAYFAMRYPDVKFVGSESNPVWLAACRERWKEVPNLSFVRLSLDQFNDWDDEDIFKADLVYTSSGLEFLDESSVRNVLHGLQLTSKRILLAEPLAVDFLMQEHTCSKRRENFVWSHPYSRYLQGEGWVDITHEIGFSEQHYWAKTVNLSAWSSALKTLA